MKSLADGLPPEIARQISPAWRKNEADYWAVREKLLSQYEGQWIGFADGAAIASGPSPVAVFHAAEASAQDPFVTCVGRENEPCRMRRVSFAYDASYPGEPLPILTLEFRRVSGSAGLVLGRVIADTGADASALPWADCQGLQLDPLQGRPGWMGGVAGGSAPTLFFFSNSSIGQNPPFIRSARQLSRSPLPTLRRACSPKAVRPMVCTSRRPHAFNSISSSVGTTGT